MLSIIMHQQSFKDLDYGGLVSLLATGVYGVVKVITNLIFVAFVCDSLGRRMSLLWTSFGQGLCMFYIAAFVKKADPAAGTNGSGAAGDIAIVAIFLFASMFSLGIGPTGWIYCSEIYTIRLRSICVGVCATSQWLFNFVVA